MNQPHPKNNLPDFSGQTKIMIVTEGNPTALLLINRYGKRNVGGMKMPSVEAALAWCRKNAAMLVVMQLDPSRH